MDKKTSSFREQLKQAIQFGQNREYRKALPLLLEITAGCRDLPESFLFLGRTYAALGNYNESIIPLEHFVTLRPGSYTGYFFLGRSHFILGNYRRAADCFKYVIHLKDDFAPAHSYAGLCALKRKKLGAAVYHLANAVERDPQNRKLHAFYIKVLLTYALKLFQMEEYTRAKEIFLFLEETDQGTITSSLYLSRIYKEAGMHGKALEYLQKARETAPKDAGLIYLEAETLINAGEPEKASGLLSRTLGDEKRDHFLQNFDGFHLFMSRISYSRGDYQLAFEYALKSMKKERTAEAHRLAAEASLAMNRIERAYNHFERIRDLEPGDRESFYGTASVLWMRQDFAEMYKILRMLGDDDPDDPFYRYYAPLCRAQLNYPIGEVILELKEWLTAYGDEPWGLALLGIQYSRINELKSAEECFRKALKKKREFLLPLQGLLTIYETKETKTGRQQYVSVAEQLLKLLPDSHAIRLKSAERLNILGKTEKAVGHLYYLHNRLPDKRISLKRKIAQFYRSGGEYRKASVVYRSLLKQDPQNESILKPYLYCLNQSGDRQLALETVEKALSFLKRPSAHLHLIYGVLLQGESRDEDALAAFRAALTISGSDWRVYQHIGTIYRRKGVESMAERFLKKADELKKREVTV